eukprot:TRINITY_DN869_c0_g1_i6.p1 TRINITY_DN869_c0_g1~~TRINITY_DN869_c0_g1_i6.p1  ORF type:complete len:325 (-),score=42.27 TRINITY_DN869_c0_g1_i6:170-1144(-)
MQVIPVLLLMTYSHTFCKACIFKWLEQNRTCPICRSPCQPSLLRADMIPTNIIDDLDVSCPSEGCQWIGKHETLIGHILSCVHTSQKSKDICRRMRNPEIQERLPSFSSLDFPLPAPSNFLVPPILPPQQASNPMYFMAHSRFVDIFLSRSFYPPPGQQPLLSPRLSTLLAQAGLSNLPNLRPSPPEQQRLPSAPLPPAPPQPNPPQSNDPQPEVIEIESDSEEVEEEEKSGTGDIIIIEDEHEHARNEQSNDEAMIAVNVPTTQQEQPAPQPEQLEQRQEPVPSPSLVEMVSTPVVFRPQVSKLRVDKERLKDTFIMKRKKLI